MSFGARNWLEIGGFSFQPSEFVKLTFVIAGAATLDKMFARKNLFVFIAFAAVCVMALALISDFGTALVFFVSYLIIAFLGRDFATVFYLSAAPCGGICGHFRQTLHRSAFCHLGKSGCSQ